MTWIRIDGPLAGNKKWDWEWGSPPDWRQRHRLHQPATAPPVASTNGGMQTMPTFISSAEYPKAQINHGKAGDDILMRYFQKHGTFAGAEIYVKPNNGPAASCTPIVPISTHLSACYRRMVPIPRV